MIVNKNELKKYNKISVSEDLRSQNKSNEFFEIMLGNLTLEEILALKFELSFKSLGFILKGFPIYKSSKYIIQDALLKVALSFTSSREEAANLLGIDKNKIYKLIKKHKLNNYYGGALNGKRKE